ncbi:MAG: MmgE/PrpD family protein [Chloroflexota bacterium]|nr:MmgE/PrpD family protein [Chloroflexota bacterium]MDE2959118.1 MmgE/PrpD family protein [Chloroflexota bacterium]
MPQDYLDLLAEFVAETRWEDFDPAAIAAAKDVVLDTVGAILAGSRLSENANFAGLAATMSGPGKSTVLGHANRVQPVWATMVNATAGVSLEMDEGNRLGGGHPSIHVTPGAIAVGEDLGRSGRDVLASIIVGYEVISRIGTATTVKAEVHSHGTWGTIGIAAAAARLMGFDAAQTRVAMNLAMSMSPANTWTPCIEGATVRNLYPGRSGFQGIMAAHLSQCGYTAIADGPADLYRTFLGDGFDPDAVVGGLGGDTYRIQQNYFKLHACCLYNHPVLDAVQDLLREEPFAPSEVKSIAVTAPPIAGIMADPHPDNMLAAKFSIPYAVAAAICYGRTDVTAFLPERVDNTDIRALAERVTLDSDPEMNLRRYDYPSARVAVQLADGRVRRAEVTSQRGDFSNPAGREELLGKFDLLARDTLGSAGVQQVIETVSRLDRLSDVGELTALLSTP